jgi:hypothetical protein
VAGANGRATAQQKGDCLENIAALVFGAVPGLELVERKAVNIAGSIEIDLVFLNNLHKNGFVDFERILVVECKNWDAPVDARAVRDFRVKLERKKRQYGFLVAAKGITGDPAEGTAAYDEIRMALVEHGLYIIVLNRTEIERLRTTADFVRLAHSKMAKIIIDA